MPRNNKGIATLEIPVQEIYAQIKIRIPNQHLEMAVDPMASKKYVLSIDAGTSSSRSILFSEQFEPVLISQRQTAQYYPQHGWVEQDPMEIWADQYSSIAEVVAQLHPSDQIVAIGIANQRETTVVWNKDTGRPLCPAIGWQCIRTADICQKLKDDPALAKHIRSATGLLPHPYFSATKLKWILDQHDPDRSLAKSGQLLFGTIDSWILFNLTGAHLTDHTNASRTMMFDINTLQWDEVILDYFDIPRCMLPQVKPSMFNFGSTSLGSFHPTLVPIMCIAGDQQAALFGHSCLDMGETKLTLGTGGFVLMNTKSKRIHSKRQLLTTLACDLDSDNRPCFALEGSILSVGSALTWAKEQGWPVASETELARDSGGISVVLATGNGLGAPHWESRARGCIFGLSRASNKSEMARAVLEAVCYQCREVLSCMIDDISDMSEDQSSDTAGSSDADQAGGFSRIETSESESSHRCALKTLRLDGGIAANDTLVQILSNVLGCRLVKQRTLEVTALGVAMMAACQAKLVDKSYLRNRQVSGDIFIPETKEVEKEHKKYARWKDSLSLCLKWCELQNSNCMEENSLDS